MIAPAVSVGARGPYESRSIELLMRVSQETELLLRSALSQSRGTSQGLYEVEIPRGGERA